MSEPLLYAAVNARLVGGSGTWPLELLLEPVDAPLLLDAEPELLDDPGPLVPVVLDAVEVLEVELVEVEAVELLEVTAEELEPLDAAEPFEVAVELVVVPVVDAAELAETLDAEEVPRVEPELAPWVPLVAVAELPDVVEMLVRPPAGSEHAHMASNNARESPLIRIPSMSM